MVRSILILFGISLLCIIDMTKDDSINLRALLQRGQLSHHFHKLNHLEWHPQGCVMRPLQTDNIEKCLRFRNLTIVGDESAMQVFRAISKRMEKSIVQKMGDINNITFSLNLQQFLGLNETHEPRLSMNAAKSLDEIYQYFHIGEDEIVIIVTNSSSVKLDTKYYDLKLVEVSSNMVSISDSKSNYPTPLVQKNGKSGFQPFLFLLPVLTFHSALDFNASAIIETAATNGSEFVLSGKPKEELRATITELWSLLKRTVDEKNDAAEFVQNVQVDIIFNIICNAINDFQYSPGCCSNQSEINIFQKSFLIMAVLVVLISLSTRVCKAKSLQERSKMINTAGSFSTVVLYCFVADRTSIFEKSSRLVDQKSFFTITTFCLGIGLLRITPCPDFRTNSTRTSWLPRSQTDEWKGWMQLVILLYHYFGMSKSLRVYQLIRLLVGSYLFLTGYGHASYFTNYADFSWRRLRTVLLRLNLLTIVLAYVMNNTYDLYYFPGLSSFWFLMSWIVLKPRFCRKVSKKELTIRLFALIVLLRLILCNKQPLQSIFTGLRQAGLIKINVHEFRFRILLDFYAPMWGVVVGFVDQTCGVNHLLFSKSLDIKNSRQIFIITSASAILLGCGILYLKFSEKEKYNEWHPILSPLPILAFVILRNSTQRLRKYYCPIFAWLGRISLETFILQYHVWLAFDAKAILRFGIMDRTLHDAEITFSSWQFWSESAIITTIFLCASTAISRASSEIVSMLNSDGNNQLSRHFSQNCADATEVKRSFSMVRNLSIGMITVVLWLINILQQ